MPSDWSSYLSGSHLIDVIPRPVLARRVLDAPQRWVTVHGAPGVGKSTLLMQVVERLRDSWTPHMLVVDPRTDARGVQELIASFGNREVVSRGLTLVIDDFDWWVADGRAQALKSALEQYPDLRLVTATLDPLEPSRYLPAGEEFSAVRSSDLVFSTGEIRDYCERVQSLAASGGTEVSPMNGRMQQRLLDSTAGMPLAVALAVDHWCFPRASRTDGFNVGLVLWPMRSVIQTRFPVSTGASGASRLGYLLSLMPRFRDEHVSMLARDLPPIRLSDLTVQLGVDPLSGSGRGGYSWRKSAWGTFTQWNQFSQSDRDALAEMLLERGDTVAAFEQFVLRGDCARAERLLHRGFAELFIRFAPEIEGHLLSIAGEDLRAHPYLRAFISILRPTNDSKGLATAVRNFALKAEVVTNRCAALGRVS
ncbi:hypothetical protein D9V30_13880 [Mycetocola reblochoni]|uniref:Uncharacterized protein n=1 Tax=Mycetocola reblochoni TaxID=331618 RepID=A0A3L6ZJ71_9MICO|nr:hypothetical protein [Mycetocola reblochoni]RLP67581.1 hypothetical protein D9V30_13880 [Mycetocola reblochoni]